MTIRSLLGNGNTTTTPTLYDIVTYTGTGSAQNISTAVDLTSGGMIWIKARSTNGNLYVFDTVRGAGYHLSMSSASTSTLDSNSLTAFGNGTFSVGTSSIINTNGTRYIAYVFKKYPGFLDIVSYTGDGSSSRAVSHSLGTAPGFVISKATNTGQNWVGTHYALRKGFYGVQGIAGTLNGGGGNPKASSYVQQDALGFGSGGGSGSSDIFATFFSACGSGRFGGGGGRWDGTGAGDGNGGQGAVVVEYGDTAIILTSGTSWNIPTGVTSIKVWCIGGGGAGYFSGGGGGGAGAVTYKTWTVTNGDVLNYTIGAAGSYSSSTNGGSTTARINAGPIITANGGSCTSGTGGSANATNADGSVAGGNTNSTSGINVDGTYIAWGAGGAIGGANAPGTYLAPYGVNGGLANDVSGLFAALAKTEEVDGYFPFLQGPYNSFIRSETVYQKLGKTSITIGNASQINNNGTPYISYIFGNDASSTGTTKAFFSVTNPLATFGTVISNISSALEPAILFTLPNVSAPLTSIYTSWEDSFSIANYRSGLYNLNSRQSSYNGTYYQRYTSVENSPSENSATLVYSDGVNSSLPASKVQNFYSTFSVSFSRPQLTTPAGTDLFNPVTYTGNATNYRTITSPNIVDMVMLRARNGLSYGSFRFTDRLIGNGALFTSTSGFESSSATSSGFTSVDSVVSGGSAFETLNGFTINNDLTAGLNNNATNYIAYTFRKYPGFFTSTYFRGTGVSRQISHNLSVAPELMIVRNINNVCAIWHKSLTGSQYLSTSTTSSPSTDTTYWNSLAPTSSVINIGSSSVVNQNGWMSVVYLFATLSGISFVGSYTGNGSSQNINCNFTNGARFVLIKRTDSSGNWFVWDSARGIGAGNDPFLTLNATTSEDSSADSLSLHSAGFGISQNATTNINVSSATYIFFAIA